MDEKKNDSGFLVFPRKSLILKRRRGLVSGEPPLGKRQPAWNKKIFVLGNPFFSIFSWIVFHNYISLACPHLAPGATPSLYSLTLSSAQCYVSISIISRTIDANIFHNWSRFLLSLADILTWGRFLPLPLPGSIALPWPLTSANLENFKSCLHFHFKGGDQLLLYRFCPKFCFRLHIQLDGGQGDRTCMGGS